MEVRPNNRAGLSLVELLVVLGIIGTMTAVAIPVIARTGLFTANKADLAARELFTILRAAKIYATTYNVETAVAYGGRIVEDSDSGQLVPIVDSVAIVRRLKRAEANALGFGPEDLIFFPLRTREGIFGRLPSETCVLPDIFKVEQDTGLSSTRLAEIRIWDVDAGELFAPRADYDLNGDESVEENTFPAHLFSPEGSIIAPEGANRITLRVGVLPNAEFSNRFFLDPSDAINDPDGNMTLFFSQEITVQPLIDPVTRDPIDIDVEIALYVATGRIKVES